MIDSGLAFTTIVYALITAFLIYLGKPEWAAFFSALGGSFIKAYNKPALLIKIMFFLVAAVLIIWFVYSYYLKESQ